MVLEKTGGIDPRSWIECKPYDYHNFKFIKQDCREYFKNNKEYFDEVYHLAAMVGGRLMIEYNPLAVAEDLAIDSMMFAWANKTKPGKIINFSSSAAYPIFLQTEKKFRLLKENDIAFDQENIGIPDLTYGWAKLTAEFTGKIAYQRHGIKSVVYRPFSGYGSSQDLSYPFPSIIKRLIELKKTSSKFYVWGSGRQMRDFVHISDCVRCVLSTKDKVINGSAINISTGKLTNFLTLAKIGLKMLDIKGVTVLGKSDKPEGVFARGGDTSLQNELGFKSTVTIEQGISESLNNLSNNF